VNDPTSEMLREKSAEATRLRNERDAALLILHDEYRIGHGMGWNESIALISVKMAEYLHALSLVRDDPGFRSTGGATVDRIVEAIRGCPNNPS
jgi:hypothetical protein